MNANSRELLMVGRDGGLDWLLVGAGRGHGIVPTNNVGNFLNPRWLAISH